MTELEQLNENINYVEDYLDNTTIDGGYEESISEVVKAARAHLEALKQEPVGKIYNVNDGLGGSYKSVVLKEHYATDHFINEHPFEYIYAAPQPQQTVVKVPVKSSVNDYQSDEWNEGYQYALKEVKILNGIN